MKYKKEALILLSILIVTAFFLIVYKPSIIGYVTTSAFILNSPPNLIANIPNQIWHISTDNDNAFDLDDYFSDPNLDPLIYIVSGNSSIIVEINSSTNKVSFSQLPNWTGTEYIVFNATDDNGETTESNNVSLTVTTITSIAPPTGIGPGSAAIWRSWDWSGGPPIPPIEIPEKIFDI